MASVVLRRRKRRILMLCQLAAFVLSLACSHSPHSVAMPLLISPHYNVCDIPIVMSPFGCEGDQAGCSAVLQLLVHPL